MYRDGIPVSDGSDEPAPVVPPKVPLAALALAADALLDA
jgi:hypothetical protein